MYMLITNATQGNGTKHIAASNSSAQNIKSQNMVQDLNMVQNQSKVQCQMAAAKLQNAETGATVSISAEGLGLSQENKDEKAMSLQEAYEKNIYQEMMESTRENTEAQSEGFQDMGKALEIARRIMDGDIVPPEDEEFLMEYDSELYMRVKSMAKPKEDPKEYDSLVEEEDKDQSVINGDGICKVIDGSHLASSTSDFPSGNIEKMKVSQV